MSIADLPHAVLHQVSVNEIALDQKESDTEPGQPSHNDPVAFRFGAFAPKEHLTKFYIAKISLDVLSRKDGQIHRAEAGFLKLAIDEVIDNDGHPVPQVAILLSDQAGTSDDLDDAVVIITGKKVRFNVPVEGLVAVAPISKVTRFYTDGGRFCVNWQDDSGDPAGIVYATHGSTDESQWLAVGKLRIDPL